jgi:hypothetical protein
MVAAFTFMTPQRLSIAAIFHRRLRRSVLRCGPSMAVLLITYKCNAETPKADNAFSQILASYQSVKLYGSNYAITADEPTIDVWQKLKARIDPDDYLVMLIFKAGTWSVKDQKVLAWLSKQPLKIEP